MNFLTGYHIIAAKNLLVHLMLWHVNTVLTTSGQHCLSFQSKLLQIQSWEGEIFKILLGHALRPPSKSGQHFAKPPQAPIHILQFCFYDNAHNNYMKDST